MQIGTRTIDGWLIDLDGVLYVGERVLPGALEVMAEMKSRGVPHRFVTNTTTHSSGELVQKLNSLGFEVEPDEVLTAPLAARAYLERNGSRRVKLVLRDEVKADFDGFEECESDADAVVIGDIGAAWTYDLMNEVFGLLMNGAELVALHRNKFWQTEKGLGLDIGCFVAGLEYCTGRDATVAGKPNAEFFRAGLDALGLPPERVAMVGDDIDSDVGGAQEQGLAGVLVRTGKYREEYASASEVQPDLVWDGIASMRFD